MHGILVRLALVAAVFLFGMGSGVWLHKKVTDSRELARLQTERETFNMQAKAEAQKAADALAAQQTLQQTINRLRSKPNASTHSQNAANSAVDSNLGACLNGDGVLDVNEAVRAANAAAGFNPAVPAAP
jgi:hypothetical protein